MKVYKGQNIMPRHWFWYAHGILKRQVEKMIAIADPKTKLFCCLNGLH